MQELAEEARQAANAEAVCKRMAAHAKLKREQEVAKSRELGTLEMQLFVGANYSMPYGLEVHSLEDSRMCGTVYQGVVSIPGFLDTIENRKKTEYI